MTEPRWSTNQCNAPPVIYCYQCELNIVASVDTVSLPLITIVLGLASALVRRIGDYSSFISLFNLSNLRLPLHW